LCHYLATTLYHDVLGLNNSRQILYWDHLLVKDPANLYQKVWLPDLGDDSASFYSFNDKVQALGFAWDDLTILINDQAYYLQDLMHSRPIAGKENGLEKLISAATRQG
jgi:hypothetical protein